LAEKEKELPKNIIAEDKIRYRVKSGDYLGKISEKYGVGISSIKRWNNLRGNNLKIGQYLTIYSGKSVSLNATSSDKNNNSNQAKSYTVRSGDSLWSISKKFPGITVQNLRSWNSITNTNLKPGMVLKLSRS
jgi:membrane-bound lytic murein transglycosylase D